MPPLNPLIDDSVLRALSSLRGFRGAPEVPPLCRETSVSRTANVGTVGINGLLIMAGARKASIMAGAQNAFVPFIMFICG